MGATRDRGFAFMQFGLSLLFILKAYYYESSGNDVGWGLFLILALANLFLAGVNWQSAEENS